MTKKRDKKRAHTGSARGETPPVGPQAASAPPPVGREQLILSNAPFHPATDSPRTKQSKDSVDKLKHLYTWNELQIYHRRLCNLDKIRSAYNATQFVGHLDRLFVDDSSTDSSNTSLEPTEVEMHAARYMTYVAWKAKNQRDPQDTTVLAGSALAIAVPVIESASMAPPSEKPLTEQALLSVLFDLGTSTGFKQAPDVLLPQVKHITGQECPRLRIWGALDSHTYPVWTFSSSAQPWWTFCRLAPIPHPTLSTP
ncbi:uncharacterized protein UMAG_03636 [Mycosarcoma maydis]|uniref:Uncharacterized protein n=1 Tax=Mycosarcoma maydis TaxID=5270 RepID=A0A0D1CN41_MYCMD|nr:uncharacterized protein UMAG_03636 [Ustilago maydis 521]KIS68053.1 hypothetical protein UMAG_03636 [Ustilago maydis 521]|eukprot:XP_011390127.1 hypothetical protein UMAG_03636 [Ustilago maydis 521]